VVRRRGADLGQHATAVSLGSRAERKASVQGSKKMGTLVWITADTLRLKAAPEIVVDVGLTLVAAPAVVQPAGHTSPGEWYGTSWSAAGLPAAWAAAREVMMGPGGEQSKG
jgi:hypothetical protein